MVNIKQKRINTRKQMTDQEISVTKKICELMNIEWQNTIGISINLKVYTER